MSESELRQRGSKSSETSKDDTSSKASAPSPAALAKAEDKGGNVLLEVARTLLLLFIMSSALSYFVTREDIFWGMKRPNWTRPDVIKTWLNGPQEFTDADLKKYDGTNPDLPIYLAINGTIYDVSNGRRHYGPGGSYHFFAGADASRAFVTNCFKEDITPDMRGVEEMFMPLDDPETDKLYAKGELKKLREQERRRAREEVHKALKHWVDFFEGSRKYTKIGKVKREKGWETKGAPHPLCERAQEGRQKRGPPPAS